MVLPPFEFFRHQICLVQVLAIPRACVGIPHGECAVFIKFEWTILRASCSRPYQPSERAGSIGGLGSLRRLCPRTSRPTHLTTELLAGTRCLKNPACGMACGWGPPTNSSPELHRKRGISASQCRCARPGPRACSSKVLPLLFWVPAQM